MAAKKKKLADYVEVRIPGAEETTRVMRGNMTDKEWADLHAGQLAVAPETPEQKAVRDAIENEEEGGDPANLADKTVASTHPEPDNEATESTPDGDEGETVESVIRSNPDTSDEAIATSMGVSPAHVADVRAFMKRVDAQKADKVVSKTPRNPVQDYVDAAKRANENGDFEDAMQYAKQARAVADYKPEYAESMRAADAEQEKAMRFLGLSKDSGGSGGGTLASKVRAMVGQEATRALPGGVEDPLMKGAEVPDPLKLTSEPPDTSKQPDTTPAPASNILGDVAGFAGDVARSTGRQLLGVLPGGQAVQQMMPGLAAAGEALPAASRGLGSQFPQQIPSDAVPPAPTETQAADKAVSETPQTPMTGSVSASMRTRGGVGAPHAPSDAVTQAIANAQALQNGAANLQITGEAAKANIARESLASQKALQEQALVDQQHIAEQQQAALAAQTKSLADSEGRLNSLMAERRALLSQRVDPDRYWNQAGVGRKVSAAIAGALFGWAGQGMDYLQYLRGVVNDDIKLQQDELRRRGDTFDALVGDQKNLIALAKQKGMTDLEAISAAKAAKYEELATQMKILAADTDMKNVNPGFAQTLAGIEQERAKAVMETAKFAQLKSNQDGQLAVEWARLRQTERIASMKMHQADAKGAKPLNATLAKQVMNTRSALATLYRMRELAKNKGFLDRMARKGKEVLTDEENAKVSQYEQLAVRLARDVAGSSLQHGEKVLIFPTIAKRSGYYDPTPNIDQAIATTEAHLRSQIDTTEAAQAGDAAALGEMGEMDPNEALPGEEALE